jgi:hypothetical protein
MPSRGREPRRIAASVGAAGALIASLLGAAPASAYRPFDFDDADVAPAHTFELELGPAEYVKQADETFLRAPFLVLNYGFGKGWEVSAEGVDRVPVGTETGASHARIQDVEAAVKKVLRVGSLQEKTGPSIAAEGAVQFPANGESGTGASLDVIASSATPSGMVHVDAEAERTPEESRVLAGGLIFEIGDENKVSPVVELGIAAERHGPPERSTLLGVIYVPDPRLEFDVAVRWAWAGEERVTEIRAGMTHQIAAFRALHHLRRVVPIPRRRVRH